MAEDKAQGVDAIFTVNVDGKQIGPAQTVTASQSSGHTEAFTFKGNWAPGEHQLSVTFDNNFLYPGTAGDRNVYVDGVTYDGQTVSSATTAIYVSPTFPPNSTTGNVYGNATFSLNDKTSISSGASSTPTTSPSPVTIGSGHDTLVLNMAEDPYLGDAQFTVSVDGHQIGGTQTTTAVVGAGQFQEFNVKGNFGSGAHTVSVDFLNDKIGAFYPPGTPGLPPGQWAVDTTDRNLYVMGASLDGGKPASGVPWELSSDGTKSFTVTAGSNPSATAYGSGLFGTNGGAAGSGNPAIPKGSAAPASSSGMSFIVSPTTTTKAATTSTTTTTDAKAPTLASTLAGTTPAAPTVSTTAATMDPKAASTTGTSSTWWTEHHGAVAGAWTDHHG